MSRKKLFSGKHAVKVRDPLNPDAVIAIKTTNGVDINSLGVTITDVSGAGAVNTQLTRNFGNKAFLTTFGDQFTHATFSGIVLSEWCKEVGHTGLGSFFKQMKPKPTDTKVPIILISHSKGDFVYTGYLVEADFGPYSKDGAKGYTFKITLEGLLAG